MKSPNDHQLNPNWEQLRQKLKSNGPKKQFTKVPKESEKETQKTILGKRKEKSGNEESNDFRPNPLIPTSSDFSLTDVVAMDCEMVGVSPMGNKSALGRVTLVNKWGNVIYDEYVRPVEYVVDFRTQISGIRPRDLRKVDESESSSTKFPVKLSGNANTPSESKDFNVVQTKVAEILKGKILVGHALRNDLKALLLTHPKKDIRDTSEYQPFLKEGRKQALRHLAKEFLGVEIQNGEHCSIEDARAAMLLYEKNRKQWEKIIKDSIRLNKRQKQRKHKRNQK